MNTATHFSKARAAFHAQLKDTILRVDAKKIPSNADKDSRISVAIAQGIVKRLGQYSSGTRLAGQSSGNRFEEICEVFIRNTFLQLEHLRPGKWRILCTASRNRLEIACFDQYQHLLALDKAAHENPDLAAVLGSDYTITPDIIIAREPEDDAIINVKKKILDDSVTRYASLRKKNNSLPILHASISCKWTIRSDRAQNARSEALNLIRNRKGPLPHICIITGEPLPSRIASIALGTGDIDCVYHFALAELLSTVQELDAEDSVNMLKTMVDGKRLRDISDLPLDLAI